jgi:uncharacterized membrane protein YraQ (UPF0718 family)/YHS domain-containing protein
MPKDPTCGMEVARESAIELLRDGREYFFCSAACRDKFLKAPLFKNKLFIVSVVSAALLFASLGIPFLVPLRISFLAYLKNIWWAVALGLFLGGCIEYYIPKEYILKVLSRKRPQTIFNAVCLGFLMSACSHGILALSIQLHKKGASNPAVVSFLLASPWANFTITLMLLGLFGLKGLLIILGAILVAINTGFIFLWLDKKGWIERNPNSMEIKEEFSIPEDLKRRFKEYRWGIKTLIVDINGITRGALSLANMVLWWIVVGMLLASIAGAYIPAHAFHRYMGPTLLGLLTTLILATIIEVCSEGSAPLAFEVYRQTRALGNSFAFLMAGVATDYTEIGLLWTNVGRRVALWMPLVAVPQIVLLGYLANLFFR